MPGFLCPTMDQIKENIKVWQEMWVGLTVHLCLQGDAGSEVHFNLDEWLPLLDGKQQKWGQMASGGAPLAWNHTTSTTAVPVMRVH